jgi:hypothetical protein
MDTGDSLLAAIEAFCAKHGMSETAFGKKAAGDGHLVRRLREDRSITLKRIDKAEKFMAEFQPTEASNAAQKVNPSHDEAA